MIFDHGFGAVALVVQICLRGFPAFFLSQAPAGGVRNRLGNEPFRFFPKDIALAHMALGSFPYLFLITGKTAVQLR